MPEAKDDLKREKVRVVPISNIEDFPDHPFQVTGTSQQQMEDTIVKALAMYRQRQKENRDAR